MSKHQGPGIQPAHLVKGVLEGFHDVIEQL